MKKDKKFITRRVFILLIGKIAILLLLVGRMFYMQFIKTKGYRTLSDKNRIKMVPLYPKRGEIFDKNGILIAENISCFRLFADKSSRNINSELSILEKAIKLTPDQMHKIRDLIKSGKMHIPVPIMNKLEWKHVALIEEMKSELSSIFIGTNIERYYPNEAHISHIIGYLSYTKTNNLPKAIKNFKIGHSGVEGYYDLKLRGNFGYKKIEVDSQNKYVRQTSEKPAISGDNLYLNIDVDLQREILPFLDEKGSSAIVMDCRNGDILLSASKPDYNPNEFVNLSHSYWNDLINNPYKPLINRTINALYPPGSIFKLVTIIAALEHGIHQNFQVKCNGRSIIGKNCFRCWKRRGHGLVNMIDAVQYSCNHYIYQIAKIVGIKNIYNVAKKFGFGSKSDIDLSSESSGFLPSPEWKRKKYNQRWMLGDTFNLAIGQGFLLSTPIQLANFMTTIATGKLFIPRIAKSNPIYRDIDIKQEYLQIIRNALYRVVNISGGTAYRSRINSFHMAGKTGTSQIMAKRNANHNLSSIDTPYKMRNHAIFAGYAPFDDPRFTILVFHDHGRSGANAGIIAKNIMKKVMVKYL